MSPLGGRSVRQGVAAVRARCRADGGQERGLAAQPCAGAVQRRRGISRCTDRSAGGCADWRTFSTTRARACGGLDAAEAAPRRRVRWRSRGRWWRGPMARATERPCRLSAVPEARLGISGKPLGREPRPPATALRQRLAAPGEGGPIPLPEQTTACMTEQASGLAAMSCPHALGKTVRTDGRTAAARGALA